MSTSEQSGTPPASAAPPATRDLKDLKQSRQGFPGLESAAAALYPFISGDKSQAVASGPNGRGFDLSTLNARASPAAEMLAGGAGIRSAFTHNPSRSNGQDSPDSQELLPSSSVKAEESSESHPSPPASDVKSAGSAPEGTPARGSFEYGQSTMPAGLSPQAAAAALCIEAEILSRLGSNPGFAFKDPNWLRAAGLLPPDVNYFSLPSTANLADTQRAASSSQQLAEPGKSADFPNGGLAGGFPIPASALQHAASIYHQQLSLPQNRRNNLPHSPIKPTKKKIYVQKACVGCKNSHVACDNSRPCQRCIRLGKPEACVDAERKKRGRPCNSARQSAGSSSSNNTKSIHPDTSSHSHPSPQGPFELPSSSSSQSSLSSVLPESVLLHVSSALYEAAVAQQQRQEGHCHHPEDHHASEPENSKRSIKKVGSPISSASKRVRTILPYSNVSAAAAALASTSAAPASHLHALLASSPDTNSVYQRILSSAAAFAFTQGLAVAGMERYHQHQHHQFQHQYNVHPSQQHRPHNPIPADDTQGRSYGSPQVDGISEDLLEAVTALYMLPEDSARRTQG